MLKSVKKHLNICKFVKEVSGSFKVLLALMLPMIIFAMGAAIDTAELYKARLNFQAAVDAGTLMAAKEYSKNGDADAAIKAGQDLFDLNMENLPSSPASISFNIDENTDCANTGITSTASLEHPVYFGAYRAWFGGSSGASPSNNTQSMASAATVMCGNDRLEIALVLDNSGSMGYNGKINTLRSAAADLVNTLYTTTANSTKVEPLRFSIVPFAATVNVGAGNRNATWMDNNGVSSIHNENLDWSQDPNAVKVGNIWRTLAGATLSRFTLYDNMNINWGGCVEARPDPYNTTDAEPTESNPDTMIVPSFAPDTPDDWSGRFDKVLVSSLGQQTCNLWQSRYRRGNLRVPRLCRRWTDGRWGRRHPQDWPYRPEYDDRIEYRYGNYIGPISSNSTWEDDNVIQEERYQNNYLQDDHNFPVSLEGDPQEKQYTGSGADQYKRQKWTWKYFTNQATGQSPRFTSGSLPTVVGLPGGPNNTCTTRPISDLTATKSATINSINALIPVGATNIQQGLIWGWRTLSPEQPFTNGREYNDDDNKKVVILMSDGNNTYYPIDYFYNGYSDLNRSYYGAYGHSVNGRIFDGFDEISNPNHDFPTFRQAVDSQLTRTCANVKGANIQVYTIAFDVPNGSSVKTMLENCASTDSGGAPLYFDASSNAELIAVFQKIAEQLAELTLTQ